METTNSGPILLKITMQVYWSDKQVILLWCHQELKISTWKSQPDFFKFCPQCGMEKHLKIMMASFFLQQQFTLYLHLDVLGVFHVREDLYADISTFLPKSIKIPVTVSH